MPVIAVYVCPEPPTSDLITLAPNSELEVTHVGLVVALYLSLVTRQKNVLEFKFSSYNALLSVIPVIVIGTALCV